MKKILILSFLLLAVAGCSKEEAGDPAGQYLVDLFNTLPQKSSLKPGVITLRGVLLYFQPTYPGIHIVDKWDTDYAEVAASAAIFNELKNIAKSRNWLINYKDGYKEI